VARSGDCLPCPKRTRAQTYAFASVEGSGHTMPPPMNEWSVDRENWFRRNGSRDPTERASAKVPQVLSEAEVVAYAKVR